MKTWNFLGAPLMLMLLAGMPWCTASATEDTTDPVVARSASGTDEGRYKEVAGDVKVTASENPTVWQAVEVEASGGAPGKLDASATIDGNVTLTNPDEEGCTYSIYGVYVHGGDGKATADIKKVFLLKTKRMAQQLASMWGVAELVQQL